MKRGVGISTGVALAALLAAGGCQKAATDANAIAANATTAPPVTGEPVATNAPPVEATAEADVKAFLDGVYVHYKSSKNNDFRPFEKDAKDVLDADTIALIAADNKAMKGEGVGVMDDDPLCDCQDFESITANVTVESATAAEAKASAVLTDTMEKTAAPTKLHFDLVKTPDGWRIHDLGDKDQPSLRKALTDEIAQLKAGK